MPAPTKVTSSWALTLRSARSRRCACTSASESPDGRSSGRPRRRAAGIDSNRSSIEPTPISASISARSRSVAEVYVVTAHSQCGGWRGRAAGAPRSLQRGAVGLGVQELLLLAGIGQADLDHPALPVGVLVDGLGAVGQRLVALDDLARER